MKNILIIDDDVIIRITFKKLLDHGNYIIQQAKDKKEAIQYLENQIYDLVLLDLRLPPTGWDAGFEILQKKRDLKLNSHTPVIIVSGARDRETIKARTDIEDNIVEILSKPVENEVLLQKIEMVLGSKE